MSTTADSAIDQVTGQLSDSASPCELLDALEAALRESKDYHRLFDAKLMRTRHELGLPVTQPTSMDNIPEDHHFTFRAAYVDAAREIGHLLLEDGRLADAWAYLRTIGEPDAVRAEIDKVSVPQEPDEKFDEIVNLALYEGAHVVRGLEFLLRTHGTCNTVTAFSQLQQQMSPDERRQAAVVMVRQIYDELQQSVRRDLESRNPVVPAKASLAELLAENENLLADGNYHIDVSHLHSVVGFSRSLTAEDPELQQVIELCEYGSRLAEPLRYPGNVPFEQYYEAHLRFLNALAGRDVAGELDWFTARMEDESDDSSRQLIAFVVLDLGQRTGQEDEALRRVAAHLGQLEDPGGFSFSKMCVEQNRLDILEESAMSNDDPIAWVTARLSATKDGS